MSKFSSRDSTRDKALKEAAKALSVAAKSLALASEALSCLYDTDEENTPTSEADRGSVEEGVHKSSHELPISIIDYEDSDDEYMALARKAISAAAITMGKAPEAPYSIEVENMWSETQNNIGTFKVPTGKDDTESETGQMDIERLSRNIKPSPGPAYVNMTTLGSQPFVTSASPGSLTKPDAELSTAPPKSWAHLLKPKPVYPGESEASGHTSQHYTLPTDHELSDDLSLHAEVLFPNLKRRWATPTGLQDKLLNPLRTGLDVLLLHSNLKSHITAILAHCIQSLKNDRSTSRSTGVISVLIIVPQQTTGRLFLQHANELLSDFGLPHKAILLPGGGSDVTIEAERMSTERIDILISSPRVFINHVNSNSNLPSHLSKIQFVVYAGAHELTKTDIFLGFQFNMVKKRMPTRAKSPRQIIIISSHMNDQIQVFASRGLHPGYATINGTESDDNLQPGSWDALLK
ncbi:hypothetical protein BN14_05480 [Rhizoctonia solani AG-1 IB]|uniref:Uncharacterized protein n=1 Tax=Thanatephorus cucumeris (strain AG1-IB / isolate 7/3/14) TaxID=1108050 RepID=M5BUQ8_THACB|nr:hypothetical protein BN14_05480 [Rhizoctonia solani AG-1 IB]